jgi:hypothetical protein
MDAIDIGDPVRWDWMGGPSPCPRTPCRGTVVRKFTERIEVIHHDGAAVTYEASRRSPVYLIEREDGLREVHPAADLVRAPPPRAAARPSGAGAGA